MLTSPHKWDPQKIEFPATKYSVQKGIESRSVSQTNVTFSTLEEKITVFGEDTIFDTQQFNELLVASVQIIDNQSMIAESKEQQQKGL